MQSSSSMVGSRFQPRIRPSCNKSNDDCERKRCEGVWRCPHDVHWQSSHARWKLSPTDLQYSCWPLNHILHKVTSPAILVVCSSLSPELSAYTMPRTSRVGRRSTGPFPQLQQLAQKARKRAASKAKSVSRPRTQQRSCSATASTHSRSTTPNCASDIESEDARPPPRKRARMAAKYTAKPVTNATSAAANSSHLPPAKAVVAQDDSDALRQRLKETEAKLAQVEQTLQNKERELVALADLQRENARLRYVPARICITAAHPRTA